MLQVNPFFLGVPKIGLVMVAGSDSSILPATGFAAANGYSTNEIGLPPFGSLDPMIIQAGVTVSDLVITQGELIVGLRQSSFSPSEVIIDGQGFPLISAGFEGGVYVFAADPGSFVFEDAETYNIVFSA